MKLPAFETVDEIYELSSEEGWDDLDYAATIELLEKWAGLGGKVKPYRYFQEMAHPRRSMHRSRCAACQLMQYLEHS